MEHQRVSDRAIGNSKPLSGHSGMLETVEALRVQLNRLGQQVRATGGETGVSALYVRSVVEARIRRREFFSAKLFADPAWDMLLELFARELEHQRISVSQLCRASGVPMTTALRWIDHLDDERLIIRRPDQTDARRVSVELSPAGAAAMQRYFEALPGRLLPL